MLINSIKTYNYKSNNLTNANKIKNINFNGLYLSPLKNNDTTNPTKKRNNKKLLYILLSLGILGGAGSAGYHIRKCDECKFDIKRITTDIRWKLFDTEHTILIDKHPQFSLINDILLISEGIESEIYYDSKGKPTIGIGHLISHKKLSEKEIWESGLLEEQLVMAKRNTGLNISSKIDFRSLNKKQIFLLYYNDLIIKEQECKNLFKKDLKGYSENKVSWDDLTSAQKAALISLSFQVGASKIAYIEGKPTKLLSAIRDGDFDKAQLEFDYSVSSSNNKKKRYIEMFLFGNGYVSPEAKKILFPEIKDKNLLEKKIKELEKILAPLTSKIEKNLW